MTFTTRPELSGTFGMVASTHWLASSAGMAVGSLAAGVLVDRVPLGALLNVQASLHLSAGVYAVIAMRLWSARHRAQGVAQFEAPSGADDRAPVHHG